MPSYAVTLTEAHLLALEYETERRNDVQASMSTPSGVPIPPLLPSQVLQALVEQQLELLLMHVRPVVQPLIAVVDQAPESAREALAGTVSRASLQRFLRVHIHTGVMP